MDIYRNVYEQQSKLFGETHPDTIVTRYRIGLCLVNQGKFEEALNYFNKVYSDHQKLFNKLHPTNNPIENGIAICLHNQEKYFDAIVFYEEVQDMQIKSLHSKHPDTLRTRYNMLLCSIKQLNIRSGPTVIWNNIQNALNKLEEIYYDQQHVLGRTHPHTLDTKRILYLKMLFNDYNMALLRYQEIYYAQVNILGEDHTDTLYTRMYIGIVICFLGDVEHSQVVLKEVYEKQKSSYGASNPYTMHTNQVINILYWGPTIGVVKWLLGRMWDFMWIFLFG
ncbi:kinesin light chain-like [Hydractinia symbiolongicarpus]|uniref:kinesin light chain-like n=1 Tax=Hydractinia symbiolongicarpus TaxID=13093 RepID=UPI00254CC9B8|nr:kinesin light chain-like [Hydractinia symbiolongicarpus]